MFTCVTKTRQFRNLVSSLQMKYSSLTPLSWLNKRQRISKYIYSDNEAFWACLFLFSSKNMLVADCQIKQQNFPHSSPERKLRLLFGDGYGQQNLPWSLCGVENFKMADVVIRSCGFRVFLPSCCRTWSGVRQLKTTANLHKGNLYF